MISVAEVSASIAAEKQAAEDRKTKDRKKSKDFYSSQTWRRLRYTALRDNREKFGKLTCVVCGDTAAPFHVDHIEPISKNWARRNDPTNLQVMCAQCNFGKSNTDKIDWRE